MNNTTLEAGSYIVCDPCEILSKADYNRMIVDSSEPFISNPFMVAQRTEHGDGIYEDTEGHEYCVDSGMIGIFTTALVSKNPGNHRKITCSDELLIQSDSTEFIVKNKKTGKMLVHIDMDLDEEENEEEDDSIFDEWDENDFESAQDCDDERPSWYPSVD